MGIPEDIFVSPDQIPLHLFCAICLDIHREPFKTPCGHVFCFPCIRAVTQTSDSCPYCREKISFKELVPDAISEETIGSLMVKCDGGVECDWTGPCRGLFLHKKTCKAGDDLSTSRNRAAAVEKNGTWTRQELSALPVRNLLQILRSRKVKHHDCIEKADLVKKVYEVMTIVRAKEPNKNTEEWDAEADNVQKMSVKELTRELKQADVDYSHCIEKPELVLLLMTTRHKQKKHNPIRQKNQERQERQRDMHVPPRAPNNTSQTSHPSGGGGGGVGGASSYMRIDPDSAGREPDHQGPGSESACCIIC